MVVLCCTRLVLARDISLKYIPMYVCWLKNYSNNGEGSIVTYMP